jgi:2-oxoisovalerate dehydrogenase E1 component
VINTLLDEQSILGLGIGAAHNDLLAITEIQFLAYVHNAEDQLRGEAATLSFFSNGQYTNPMIVRIAGLGYQKGFGGHFHNDNSLAVFRDIPGLILACPSNGADAVEMLRECVRLALEEQRVIVFVEPIALYMTRDLHEEGDGLWTATYAAPGEAKPIRSARSASMATAPTSPSSATATAIISPARPRRS